MALFGDPSAVDTFLRMIQQEGSGPATSGPAGTGVTSWAQAANAPMNGVVSPEIMKRIFGSLGQAPQAPQPAQPTPGGQSPAVAAGAGMGQGQDVPMIPTAGQDAGQVAAASAANAIAAARGGSQMPAGAAPVAQGPMPPQQPQMPPADASGAPQGILNTIGHDVMQGVRGAGHEVMQGVRGVEGMMGGQPQPGQVPQGAPAPQGAVNPQDPNAAYAAEVQRLAHPGFKDWFMAGLAPNVYNAMQQRKMMGINLLADQAWQNNPHLTGAQTAAATAAPATPATPAGAFPAADPSAPGANPAAPGPGLIGGAMPRPQAAPATASASNGPTPKQVLDWNKATVQELTQDPDFIHALSSPVWGERAKALLDAKVKGNPEYVSMGNFAVNKSNPRDRVAIPQKAPDGAVVDGWDAAGNPISVHPMNGYTNVIGANTRATADATNASEASYAGVKSANTAAGSAPYTPDNRQDSNGAPVYGVVSDRYATPGAPGARPTAGVGLHGQSTGDNQAAKSYAEQAQKDHTSWQATGVGAQAQLDSISRLRQLDSQFTSGALSDPTTVYRTAAALGVPLQKGLDAASAYKQMTTALLGDLKQNLGQMRLAGPEIKFLQGLSPSVSNTPGANKMIYDSIEKVAQRKLYFAQQREAWDNTYGIGGKIPAGQKGAGTSFEAWQQRYNQLHPLFPNLGH